MNIPKFKAVVDGKIEPVYAIKESIDGLFVLSGDYKKSTTHNIKDVKLIQYTGKKDKNREYIYVGDILKYEGNSRYREVYFDKNKLQYRIKCKSNDGTYTTNYSMEGLILERIGNIYENPELMNK